MEMMKKIYAFTDNYRSAFIAYDFKENKVLYSNKTALEMYGIREQTGLTDFLNTFENNNLSLEVKIKTGFLNQGYATFDNILTKKSDGTGQLVHLMIGYFNEENTEIFIELTPKTDSRMEMALYQLEQSSKAEAVLEYDECLTLFCCNQPFCKLLNAGQSHCLVQHGAVLGEMFENVNREEFLKEVHDALKKTNSFATEVQIRTTSGEKKWVLLELQRRTIDETGEKLMCSMVCIDELKNEAVKLNIFAQYFEVMGCLSGESLYTVNLNTRLLQCQGIAAEELGLPPEVEGYPECVYDWVHPDDFDNFKVFSSQSVAGIESKLTLRIKNSDGTFQWYELFNMIIRDDKGDAIEILGRIKNIHQEQETKAKNLEISKYFTAMQELTDNILYRVDIPTMTLHHTVKSPKAEKLGESIPNYAETLIAEKIVHPEDVENYRQYLIDWYGGTDRECTIRFAFISEEYQWYQVRGKKIFDDEGNLIEVVGSLINVNEEHSLKAEFSVINQYFNAMQDFTKDILFRIDVKTETFYHSDPNAQGLGVPIVIPDFVNVFVANGFVRPEDAQAYRDYTAKLMSGENMEYEIQAAVNVGVYEWFHIKSKFIYDEKGNPTEIFGKMENIQNKKDLVKRATHDQMTGVLNKVTFEEEIELLLRNSSPNDKHALIFIDLDDFKSVNDNLGHAFGDFLLITVGKRLKRIVRESDMVGRVGGDEFVVFLRGIDSESSALVRTNLMLDSINQDFSLDGKSRAMKASLGVAIYPQHGENYKALNSKADIAMYASKHKGKNVVTLYSVELEEY